MGVAEGSAAEGLWGLGQRQLLSRALRPNDEPAANASPRRHTVGRGDNAWTIAKRYRIRVADLLKRNGLNAKAVLKPGQALLIDAPNGGRD